jgi:tight adherence protein C
MEPTQLLAAVALSAIGGVIIAAALTQRRVSTDAADWLDTELDHGGGVVARRPSSAAALLRATWGRVAHALAGRAPAAVLERQHEQILRAGLSNAIRAEEFVAVSVLAPTGALVAGLAWITAAHPSPRLGVLGLVFLGVVGFCAPRAWLTRRVAERQEAIFKDLPDALDLMVIAMEAGVSFDAAIQVVADHLEGPLGSELLRTLTEMELGLSRREALQNLRRRTDVTELNHVIISLLQADSLGMPVGKVLRAQAAEMRLKRRQWAREKAGKLPIKILFPLVLFIFPPVMVVVIGPAFSDIAKIF